MNKTISTYAYASTMYLGTETLCTRETADAVVELARGSYQSRLLLDEQRWSGGDLRGRASHYGAQYARSRASLLARIRRAGYVVTRTTGYRGRVVMIVETREEAERREALTSGDVVVGLAGLAA